MRWKAGKPKIAYSWQTAWLYVSDRAILLALVVALLTTQAGVWLLWFKQSSLPSEVPLWYTATPMDQLAPVEWLWLIPGLASISLLFNIGLGLWLHRRYAAISRMLVVVAAGLGIMGLVAIMKTILIFTKLL